MTAEYAGPTTLNPIRPLYHYTCDHGRTGIGEEGKLVPPINLVDEPWTYAKWPQWKRRLLDIIWMTDLETPMVDALGLTQESIGCDRTAHRYRVVGYVPMHYPAVRRDLPKRLRDLLEAKTAALPMHWYIAYTPVPVIYDPERVSGSI